MFTNKSSNRQTVNLVRSLDTQREYSKVQSTAVQSGNAERQRVNTLTTAQRLAYLRSLQDKES